MSPGRPGTQPVTTRRAPNRTAMPREGAWARSCRARQPAERAAAPHSRRAGGRRGPAPSSALPRPARRRRRDTSEGGLLSKRGYEGFAISVGIKKKKVHTRRHLAQAQTKTPRGPITGFTARGSSLPPTGERHAHRRTAQARRPFWAKLKPSTSNQQN